jgi:hypothetical protein
MDRREKLLVYSGAGVFAAAGVAVFLHLRRRAAAEAAYQFQASLSSPSQVVTSPIPQDTITVTFTTLQAGQPLPNQAVQVTIQRQSGPSQETLTTNSQGQVQVPLYTAHPQTMTVTGVWVDPLGVRHTATVTPTWTAPALQPGQVQTTYTLGLSVQPNPVRPGQPVTVTVQTFATTLYQGQATVPGTGTQPLAGQTVQISGLATGTLTTGSDGTASSQVTPAGSGTLVATWTDPAGTQHQQSVTVTVSSTAQPTPTNMPSPNAPTTFTVSPNLGVQAWLNATTVTQVTLNGVPVQVFPQGPGDTAFWNYLLQTPSFVLSQLQTALNARQINSYVLAAGVQLGYVRGS